MSVLRNLQEQQLEAAWAIQKVVHQWWTRERSSSPLPCSTSWAQLSPGCYSIIVAGRTLKGTSEYQVKLRSSTNQLPFCYRRLSFAHLRPPERRTWTLTTDKRPAIRFTAWTFISPTEIFTWPLTLPNSYPESPEVPALSLSHPLPGKPTWMESDKYTQVLWTLKSTSESWAKENERQNAHLTGSGKCPRKPPWNSWDTHQQPFLCSSSPKLLNCQCFNVSSTPFSCLPSIKLTTVLLMEKAVVIPWKQKDWIW